MVEESIKEKRKRGNFMYETKDNVVEEEHVFVLCGNI